ncbi:9104_t:CDS:2, partial [Acaulospora morrowiae]
MSEKITTQTHCQPLRKKGLNTELVRVRKTIAKRNQRATFSAARQQHERERNTQQRRLARRNYCSPPSSHHCEALQFTNDFPQVANIGRMEIECRHCGALHFPRERTAGDLDQFTSCCHKGTVALPSLLPFPDELRLLFLREHPISSAFYNYIRKYNSAMAFASVVSNIQLPSGRGLYAYKILRQMYHFLGSAQPNEGDIPSFGQLYFLDTTDAQEYRNSNPANAKLDPALLLLLNSVLQQKHDVAIQQGHQPMEVQMVFDNDRHLDQRFYNAPQ